MSYITRAEAIEHLKDLDDIVGLDAYGRKAITIDIEDIKAIRFAIASLETDEAYQLEHEQPEFCEDCISRESAQLCLTGENLPENRNEYIALVSKRLRKLPSVLPKAKKGHWIEHDWKEFLEEGYYRCSVCNHGYQRYTKGIRKSDVPYIDGQEYILWNCDNYCPNCGAKMVEPQESEELEDGKID